MKLTIPMTNVGCAFITRLSNWSVDPTRKSGVAKACELMNSNYSTDTTQWSFLPPNMFVFGRNFCWGRSLVTVSYVGLSTSKSQFLLENATGLELKEYREREP